MLLIRYETIYRSVRMGVAYKGKVLIAAGLFVAGLLYCGCSSRLLTKNDYRVSVEYLKMGNPQYALHMYPKGEEHTFITIMERTYLNLLSGNPDINELQRYSKKIENRVRFRVSREIQSLFYVETPEGYYASEHEIIWMHMLLSWGYSLRRDYEKAYVEAKKASILLSTNWSAEGRFDDPLLRVILGGLWAMCGRWDEAQVDFRVAADLDPSLKWARKLGTINTPPKKLVMVLGGAGQEPVWEPTIKNHRTRGARGIMFMRNGEMSRIAASDGRNRSITMHCTPDSSPWYRRHFIRDNEIQEKIQDSRYEAKMFGATALSGTTLAAGTVAGIAALAVGVGAGVGIVAAHLYFGIWEDASALTFALAAGAAAGGAGAGINIYNKSYERSRRQAREIMDTSRTYRFVRFLPEYAWIGWGSRSYSLPLKIQKKGYRKDVPHRVEPVFRMRNNVFFSFFPDVPEHALLINKRESAGVRDQAFFKSLDRLHNAVDMNETEEAVRLVDNGAPLNVRDRAGRLPLHLALANNNVKLAAMLIDKGADVNFRNEKGKTALHIAAFHGSVSLLQKLVDHNGQLSANDNYHDTPLHIALLFNREKAAAFLIMKGADVNAGNKSGWTPLHHAAKYDNVAMVRLLVNKGARINVRTKEPFAKYPERCTPLAVARIHGNEAVEKYLKSRGGR